MVAASKKKGFKYWLRKAHLILGLTSGLIVFVLGVTGCIFVFNQEITNALRKDVIYVKAPAGERIPVTDLWKRAQSRIDKSLTITHVTVYKDPKRSVMFHCYKFSDDHLFFYDNVDQYIDIYVNPYTGKVLAVYDEELDFFVFIKALHWSLLLNDSIGQTITGSATLIFVIMLISGIILWWPRNKSAYKQRIWFRWKRHTRWRRKNYDLHNILGFYIAAVACIIAFTGMVWAFTWFKQLVYTAGSFELKPFENLAAQSSPADASEAAKEAAYNHAFTESMKRHPDAGAFWAGKPLDNLAPIDIYILHNVGTYYKSHQMLFDQYTGALLKERTHAEKNFGEKLITANYDIHVGAILGLPGKILAFIVSFVCAMLPVTGFLVWRGRRK